MAGFGCDQTPRTTFGRAFILFKRKKIFQFVKSYKGVLEIVKTAKPIKKMQDKLKATVFSSTREIQIPNIKLARNLLLNKRLKMEGLRFLSKLPKEKIPVAFFDPQYRGVLDKLEYGNEGKKRGKARSSLPQMSEKVIGKFVQAINTVLIPSGHLFLWMDKFHLCTGFQHWLDGTDLEVVDMLTWNKGKMGMGYRTRRMCEYVVVLQKYPRRAKGVWKLHNIPDVFEESVDRSGYIHKKPVRLQGKLIEAVSNEGDVVIDPASGSFSVLESCKLHKRHFLGCDING